MEISYQHAQSQRVLRQRNLFAAASLLLAAVVAILMFVSANREREAVLLPILSGPLTVTSAGPSREYLELVTRDTAVLTLNRTPNSLDYWMNAVLAIVSPKSRGAIKAELLKIVDEQRGSSMSQFFTMESMDIDPEALRSTVSGTLNTVVGQKIVSAEPRTFVYDWEYTGMSLKLAGFRMVQPKDRSGVAK